MKLNLSIEYFLDEIEERKECIVSVFVRFVFALLSVQQIHKIIKLNG
jgi:hypothetical protein